MEEQLIIQGTTAGYKDMADDSIRITIEVDPSQAEKTARLNVLGRGIRVAVAVLSEEGGHGHG